MSLALRPETELAVEPLVHRVRALREARDRYQLQITAQRAVLELAQAQGDEKEAEHALVEITLALHARAVAQRHLERLGSCAEGALTGPEVSCTDSPECCGATRTT
jgi:hypothetical protein